MMKRLVRIWLAVVVAVVVTGASADTLRLRDGSEIEGTLVGSDARQLRFMASDGTVTAYPITGVGAVLFSSTQGLVPSAPTVSRRPAAPPSVPPGVTVPAGTPIVVRLIDGIDSTKTAVGERFRATLDDPIVVGDRVAIPRGADATVQIIQAKGSKELFIKLYDITINGRPYDAVTDYAQVKSPGKGKKYARRTVGLGALGAAIGAIAGGGKGALIGAAVGAGTGAVTVAAKGSKIQLPPETRLAFELRAPLPLN